MTIIKPEYYSNAEIGSKIRKRRKELGLSQTKLAYYIGISYQQLQKYEKADTLLTVEKLIMIASALDVQIGYFLERSSEEPPIERATTEKESEKESEKDERFELLTKSLKGAKFTKSESDLLKAFNAIKDNNIRRGLMFLIKSFAKKKY